MGLVLDTSVLVASRRRRFDLAKALRGYADMAIGIAAISAAELLRGAAARAERRFYVDGLIEFVPILPFGLPEAREYARIWAGLANQDTALGPHHLMVAATAMSLEWALMTLDPGDFEPVDGLVLAPLRN